MRDPGRKGPGLCARRTLLCESNAKGLRSAYAAQDCLGRCCGPGMSGYALRLKLLRASSQQLLAAIMAMSP